jgi:hypothetical protein
MVHAASLKFAACRPVRVMDVPTERTAAMKPFLAWPLAGIDEIDPACFAFDGVLVLKNRSRAHL